MFRTDRDLVSRLIPDMPHRTDAVTDPLHVGNPDVTLQEACQILQGNMSGPTSN